MLDWIFHTKDNRYFDAVLSTLKGEGKITEPHNDSEMLDVLMFPSKELLDKLALACPDVEEETIFVALCACCLEAFTLAVVDNRRLLGGMEAAGRFWEGWAGLIQAGMPWLYKKPSLRQRVSHACADLPDLDRSSDVIDSIYKQAEPEVDRIRSRIRDGWTKIHNALPTLIPWDDKLPARVAKAAWLLIDSNESHLDPTNTKLLADLFSNKRILARVFVRRTRAERRAS